MNEKITLPLLIQLLSRQTGDTRKQTEDFIKEFFGLIASSLADGDVVKIKSLGVFKTISVGSRKSVNVATGEDNEIPSHRKVVFVPTKEVAALVNEPFEMFETVELDNNIEFEEEEEEITTQVPEEDTKEIDEVNSTDETLASDENAGDQTDDQTDDQISGEVSDQTTEDTAKEMTVENEIVSCTEEEEDTDVVYVIDSESGADIDQVADEQQKRRFVEPADDRDDDEETAEPDEHGRRRKKFYRGFLVGFLSGVVFCGLVLIAMYYSGMSARLTGNANLPSVKDTVGSIEPVVPETALATQEVKVNDSLEESSVAAKADLSANGNVHDAASDNDAAPTAPSDKKVTDVISKTRYLTTMAKDHYGNFNLWPYIYIENKAFLGHPDRIKPGTVVVIPDLRKYGVNPDNPADIAKAKKKGIEIYSRYK